MKEEIEFSEIEQGQYTVEMNLNILMDNCQRYGLEKQITEIQHYENEYAFVSSLKDGVLKYRSETLFPEDVDTDKQKLLFVFGNPANHSIINGMFFFSKQNGDRHQLWGKLADAGVVKSVNCLENIPLVARRKEANRRREMLWDGTSSDQYLVGLTTFYSFPTSAEGGVKRVGQLFAPIINEINKKETERILKYSFTEGARLIFVQKSSYCAFQRVIGNRISNTLFWPIRGKGSSGKNLEKHLKE